MNSEPVKILLIEDNPGDAHLIREMLAEVRGALFDLAWVDRLSTGLERLAEGGIDLILLDLSLPDSQGIDTFVRTHAQAPEVPIVVLSGLDDEALALNAMKEGAQDYLVKGQVEGDSLARAIPYAIERKQNELRLRNIIEKNADGIIIVDKDGLVQFVNPAAVALFERKAEELLGEMFGFPVVADEITELDIIHGDGETVTAEMRVVETEWEGEISYLASLRDITERRRAEEALKASQEYAKNLIDSSIDMIIAVDKDRKINEFNKAAQEIFGYRAVEVLGKHVDILYADRDEGIQVHTTTLESGICIKEVMNKRKNGEIFPCILSASILHDPEGNIVGVMGVSRDITEQKRAEAEKLRLASFPTKNPNPILESDSEGRLRYINPAAEELRVSLGVGQVTDMLPENHAQLVGTVLEEGESFQGFGVTVKERIFSWSYHPVPDIGVVHLYGEDITDRQRADGTLRESERRFRDLYDQAPVGYHEGDSEGRIVRVNRTELNMLGYIAEEMVGRYPWEFIVEEETSQRAIEAVLNGNELHRPYELTWRKKDGILLSALMQDHPLQDTHGRVAGLRTTIQDITERKQIERQLFQSQKMESVGTLAGGIAHDFNNLLTTIIGFAQIAMLDSELSDQTRKYISKIPEQGQRAAKLISQLLTFSRKAVTERLPMQLLYLVKETVKILGRTVPENISIRVSWSGEVALVDADSTQMQQVILNLCVNASHSMPDGGEMTLGLKNETLDQEYCRLRSDAQPGNYVCLSVRDTGGGMTPEVQERIFEPFFTTKEVGKGTGLGLSMVYGIIKAHEGHISVDSELGKGTEFKVYLPTVAPVPRFHRKLWRNELWVERRRCCW